MTLEMSGGRLGRKTNIEYVQKQINEKKCIQSYTVREKSSPWVAAVFVFSEVGVLGEHLSQLSPLSDVAVHARQST